MAKSLDALRAKKHNIEFNGVELELKSLTFPQLTKLSTFMESKNTQGALDYILFTALRGALLEEEFGDDDIKKLVEEMDSKVAMDIVKKVQEISGLVGEEPKKPDAPLAGKE